MSDSGIKKGVQVCDDLFSLRVSPDRLEATLHPLGELTEADASSKLERLKREAGDYGIIYGLLPALERMEDGSFCLARGKAPVHGENARIKLHVKPSIAQPRRPLPGQDKVDYRELGNIVNVNRDQFLLEKVPLTEGVPGRDVLGGIVMSKAGRDIRLRPGPGVRITEDETKVYATLNGKFVMVEGKPCVFGEHLIRGDVDLSVGNVVFTGDALHIQGEVLPGFKVKCRGDISIQNGINNAEVLAGGRLLVRGSVVGEQAVVRAKGDMVLGFVENGPLIECLGTLTVTDFIVQGKVRVGGDLNVFQGNGTLIGGQHVVGGSIFVKELGSEGEVVTELNVGISPSLELQKTRLENEMKIWPEKFNEVLKNISALRQMKKKEGSLSPAKEALLAKLTAVMPKLADKVSTLTDLEKEIAAGKEKLVKEAVYVYGRVYPGVVVKIGSAVRAITAKEEAVVIQTDGKSCQILVRKMSPEERQAMGRLQGVN
jgi:uncharacterized protein